MTVDASTSVNLERTQQLYRLYDAEGQLLYVGISYSAIARFAQHKADKPWIADVARVDIETHSVSRAEIAEIERLAILAERPLHNVVHNSPTSNPTTKAEHVSDDPSRPISYDISWWPGRAHLVAALHALSDYARYLDRAYSAGRITPDRELFVRDMSAALRSLTFGDSTCETCEAQRRDEIDMPLRVDVEGQWATAYYQCQHNHKPRRAFWGTEA